jgi:hypothetical protein
MSNAHSVALHVAASRELLIRHRQLRDELARSLSTMVAQCQALKLRLAPPADSDSLPRENAIVEVLENDRPME